MSPPERPLLFVGDLHLGRRPVGLTAALEAAGLTPRQLSPTAAWQRAVEHALAVRARAVVLAGDVVDRAKDRFEAYAPLESGARALTQAGVPVYAVAGNHDSLVLPRLAQQVPGVTLLGAGGRWEVVHLPDGAPPKNDKPDAEQDAEPVSPVDLLGWSFPQRHVSQDPTLLPSFHEALHGAASKHRPNAVTLGVVHGDLGATASRYAPLDPGRLSRAPVAAWFLGHIHRPDDLDAPDAPEALEAPDVPDAPRAPDATGPLMGYLGSLVGLDPGEPGWHGAWEVRTRGGVHARRVHLAPARWERLDVPVPPMAPHVATDPDAGADLVVGAVRAAVGRAAADLASSLPSSRAPSGPTPPPLLAALWRVRLVQPETGPTPAGQAAPASSSWSTQRAAARKAIAGLLDDAGRPSPAAYFEAGGLPCVIERLTDDVRPPRAALDLDALAGLPTPVGWLARQIQALDAPRASEGGPREDALPASLAALAQRALAPLHGPTWRPDEVSALPPTRDLLRAAAWRALEALVSQRQGPDDTLSGAPPAQQGRA